ncbi:hypothetical protein M406DRAFT_104715 [Cryphonectria parasitica EP155]|uniref:Uncharacterized protein n=1 Tax=Cryphonectria parasitica (strain ATCC 38755 / EP155) TaxID=660469 RepID=A0A9P4Y9J4_CRYP1|nr:uncharacterized protein M406DRAFT_104715 [Cryphonectria parasitica EP155]KAF3769261.1 hypothetical protein M406DRAFT_104715 [Cryphonectria parasitica EP155]
MSTIPIGAKRQIKEKTPDERQTMQENLFGSMVSWETNAILSDCAERTVGDANVYMQRRKRKRKIKGAKVKTEEKEKKLQRNADCRGKASCRQQNGK